MKILHICVCGPFTDGFSYQENELVEQHVMQGHEVAVIASTETYGSDKTISTVLPGRSKLACGALLIRLQYPNFFFGGLAEKIRAHSGLRSSLEELSPDRIVFHGLSAWDLITVASYVRRHPNVHLFADCHSDFNNSATTWLSREILHKCFYKSIFQHSVKQIRAVLCVTVESFEFAVDVYGSPPEKTRIFPLGCLIESTETIERRRTHFRNEYRIDSSAVVIVQTGKLDPTKQLVHALSAFCSIVSKNVRFVIAGRMTDVVREECRPLILSDDRIIDLGWKTTDELRTVLAGADCFLQPFGQTVTTQMAMGYGCAILAQDLPSHRWLIGERGRLINDSYELKALFEWVIENPEKLATMKSASRFFAQEHLDYRKLALQLVE